MNKIYKVIWSKVRNCYVAVSEIAKRNGKSGSAICRGSSVTRGGVALAIALSLSMAGGDVAWGASIPGTYNNPHTVSANEEDETYTLYGSGTTADTGVSITVANGGTVRAITSNTSGNNVIIEAGGIVVNGITAGRNNNKVTIFGTVGDRIYGGYGGGDVTGNSVTISSGTAGEVVCGGYSASGNATGNSVTVVNGTVEGNDHNDGVFGGWAYSNGNGNATGNEVTIDNSTVKAHVWGGYSSNGNATGNKVILKNGARIDGTVYGAQTYNGQDASNNTVELQGATIDQWLVGGSGVNATNRTGCELILSKEGNNVVQAVGCFETIRVSNALAWSPV